MKMSKSLCLTVAAIIVSGFILTGCASSEGEEVHILDADRAGGTVTIGFIHNAEAVVITDGGVKANWNSGFREAQQACQKWGYPDADWLSPMVTETQRYDTQKFTMKIQCVVSANQEQVPGLL